MKGRGNTTTDRKEASYLRVTKVRWLHTPGNEHRFKKLFDLLLRPVPVKEGHENGKAEQGEGTEGEDTLCE